MPVMRQVLEKCKEEYGQQHPERELRILSSLPETVVSKLLTLILLPCLSLERCYNLIGYQGHGLAAIVPNGVHYKYGCLELFLNELAQLDFGHPLTDALADVFCQTFYPGRGSLLTYWDYCVKPLWTKYPQPKSKVTRIGRVMACTKMLFAHGPEGHPLYLIERPGDTDLNDDLPKAQDAFVAATGRQTRICVVDREGNSLFLALTGVQNGHSPRSYLTMLDKNQYKSLDDFEVSTAWQSLEASHKPDLEVAWARWKSPTKRQRDPRRFFLIRSVNDPQSRLAVGCIHQPPSRLRASDAYAIYHGRWGCQEHRFREMYPMALGANYGYLRVTIPNRTAQRQLTTAQKQVEATDHQRATLRRRLDHQADRIARWTTRFEARWAKRCAKCRELRHQLQDQPEPTRRLQQRLDHLQLECQADLLSHQQRLTTIQNKDITPLLDKHVQLEARLTQRQQAVSDISLDTPFYERDLNKDLVMMICKMVLLNAHYYVQDHFCTSEEWQKAEFATLRAHLYQKPGLVRVWPNRVEVVLEPYRYAHLQQYAEDACKLFNAASLQDELGRRVVMHVAASEQEFAELGGVPTRN